jgi:protein TonB
MHIRTGVAGCIARYFAGCFAALLLATGLGGCSAIQTAASSLTDSIGSVVERITHPGPPPAPSQPSPAGLDSYKAEVAQHVMRHNPEHNFSGQLPPLLPAIVVLEITVDRDGQLDKVAVQRSRNPDAAEVALAAMRRSTPLPRPQQLAQATGKLTFSETFLFADRERYQLRSLAGPQASE